MNCIKIVSFRDNYFELNQFWFQVYLKVLAVKIGIKTQVDKFFSRNYLKVRILKKSF